MSTMPPAIPPFPPEWGEEPDARELERLWADLEVARPAPVAVETTDQDWAELRTRLGTPALARELEARSRPSPHSGVWASAALRRPLAAAAVLVLVVAGSLTLLGLPAGIEALPGETVSATLPDGSTVELNSGSRIRWRRSIMPGSSPPRAYSLSGEAFLSVVPGAGSFVLETYNARVTVLGTRFNVRAREGVGSGTEVVLEEGRVRLSHTGTGAAVELAPGESAAMSEGAAGPAPPRPVEVDRVLAWRERGFSAVQRPLEEILLELSLRYGVDIGLTDGVDGAQRLTVHYARLGELREVLSDLSTARGLRFRETSGGFEVY